jgi:citrate lyase subunit beta/citryl-CoA lyase/(S)-citramalyl-CoA lyase
MCIDLEDAVPPDGKDAARAAVLDYLKCGADVGVRINAVDTSWGRADMAAVAGHVVSFVMIPKVASADAIGIARAALGGIDLVAVIESAEGLRNAWEITSAPGVVAILFGGADYSADIGAELAWEPMLHARGALAAAAGGARKHLLDVPYLEIDDDVGLIDSTRRARAMGFTGRACIHPKQIPGVHTAFTPIEAELSRARRVLSAFEAAKGGAALLDGKLVELPVVLHARRVLAAAGER